MRGFLASVGVVLSVAFLIFWTWTQGGRLILRWRPQWLRGPSRTMWFSVTWSLISCGVAVVLFSFLVDWGVWSWSIFVWFPLGALMLQVVSAYDDALYHSVENMEEREQSDRMIMNFRREKLTPEIMRHLRTLGVWMVPIYRPVERVKFVSKSSEERELDRSRLVMMQGLISSLPRNFKASFGDLRYLRVAYPGAWKNQKVEVSDDRPQGDVAYHSLVIANTGSGKTVFVAEGAGSALKRDDVDKVIILNLKRTSDAEKGADICGQVMAAGDLGTDDCYSWPRPMTSFMPKWEMFRGVCNTKTGMEDFVNTMQGLVNPDQTHTTGAAAHYADMARSYLTIVYHVRYMITSFEHLSNLLDPDAMTRLVTDRMSAVTQGADQLIDNEIEHLRDNAYKPLKESFKGRKGRDLEATRSKLAGNLNILMQQASNILLSEDRLREGTWFDDDYKLMYLEAPNQALARWLVEDVSLYCTRLKRASERVLLIIDEIGSLPKAPGSLELGPTPTGQLLQQALEQLRSENVHVQLVGQSIRTFGVETIRSLQGAGVTLHIGQSGDKDLNDLLIESVSDSFTEEVREGDDGERGRGQNRRSGVPVNLIGKLPKGSFVSASGGNWMVNQTVYVEPSIEQDNAVRRLTAMMEAYGGTTSAALHHKVVAQLSAGQPLDTTAATELLSKKSSKYLIPQTTPEAEREAYRAENPPTERQSYPNPQTSQRDKASESGEMWD